MEQVMLPVWSTLSYDDDYIINVANALYFLFYISLFILLYFKTEQSQTDLN